MKYTAVTLAVLAGLTSGSALAAKVYSADGTELKVGGRVEFRGDFIGDDGAEIEGTMADSTRARVNLKGKSQITDSLTAFGVYEAEQDTGSNEFENRYMYAGIEGAFGVVSFGRQDMASVIVSDFTDITEFSGVQQVIDTASDKEDSVFSYAYEADALVVQATYQAQSAEDTDGYSLAGVYSAPFGLDVGLAFSGGDLGKNAGSESEVLFGLGFSIENLYLGATYSQGDFNDKATGVAAKEFEAMEFVAEYQVTDAVTAAALYTKLESEAGNGSKSDETEGVELVGYYQFNSHFRTYVSYYINGLDEVKTAGVVTQGEDTLRLGVRYDF
ncbi:porin [Vibrio taketomensis]|uniref:porin n=1 Tax=Vibrio taketomensis TaxID=2572923 RepID=UPI00138A209A|nr:porin [Vibrio taketomensis]